MSERLQNNLAEINLNETGWNLSAVINPEGNIISLNVDGEKIDIPQNQFESFGIATEKGQLVIKDFSDHPMNLGKRHGGMTDLSLVDTDQNKLIVMKNEGGKVSGLILSKNIIGGNIVSRVDIVQDPKSSIPFKISLFDMQKGAIEPIGIEKPGKKAKILHTTQILGHVKDACDMQIFAHKNGTLVDKWFFGLPPTTQRSKNQTGLTQKGIPSNQVTMSWTYGPESEELPSDFRKPESFESVLGFLAANSELVKKVAKGEFKIVSTNFKQEGNLLKLINPDVILTGINFTFLNGRPGERLGKHKDSPKLVRMLERVQNSLNMAPKVLEKIAGRKVQEGDWWRLTNEKLVNVQVLLFRVFSFDKTLPEKIGNTDIIQVPHPIPEIRFNREQSRKHLEKIINKEIPLNTKIILLPGTSEDGLFDQRLKTVTNVAKDRNDVIVILPLEITDKRLKDKVLPSNIVPIGFRGDWMDVIPSADVTFIRGGWGEIVDVVASGITPIFMSPGTVPGSGDIGDIQFLTEVSGERATNVSLFVEELKKQGVSSEIINGLLADIADPSRPNELENAIEFALQPEVHQTVRKALSKTKKDGIAWMVKIHELLLANGRVPTQQEIDRLHKQIWNY